jgi:opacity protein-like surface antigen
MNVRLPLFFVFCIIVGPGFVSAQDKKFELNGQLGFTLSEGVNVDTREGDELGVERLSPKSAFSYGLGVDYYLNENFSIGFVFAREKSVLRAGVADLEGVDIANMNVNDFHGILTYNFGAEDDQIRPFVFAGLGATSYSPDSIDGNRIEGATKFSTTWGGGVKYFIREDIGIKAGVRWTPTRIGSESGGLFCSSYWPWECWTVENPNFSHQFEFSFGVVGRF